MNPSTQPTFLPHGFCTPYPLTGCFLAWSHEAGTSESMRSFIHWGARPERSRVEGGERSFGGMAWDAEPPSSSPVWEAVAPQPHPTPPPTSFGFQTPDGDSPCRAPTVSLASSPGTMPCGGLE